MAYDVYVDPALVLDYLCSPTLGFSDQDLDRILDFLEKELGETGDVYRNDPSRRIQQGSANFQVDLVFWASSGKIRHLRFVVSDAKASYGVLLVRYVDEL